MTVEQFVSTIATLAGLTFVVGSMFATGLSLTVGQIVQPLKNARLVILALIANFALVPLLGYVITLVIPLDEPLKIGLIVLSTVAGAPFLIKEVQASKGKLSLGVGLMFLLMIVTIFYVPLVLPLLLPGVDVNAGEIAKSLIVTMLIPIVIGLLVRSHSAEGAKRWAPVMNKRLRHRPAAHAGDRARAEHLQHHRPDRLVRLPGARRLRRRIAGDRLRLRRPGCRRPQHTRAGHGATQRGGRDPRREPELRRHRDAALRARRLHRPAADPAPRGAPDRQARQGGDDGPAASDEAAPA